jgi:hypothetical protein
VFAPQDAQARVLSRLGPLLIGPGGGGGGPGGAGGATDAGRAVRAAAAAGPWARGAWLALAFLVGGATGAAVLRATESPRIVYVDRVAPALPPAVAPRAEPAPSTAPLAEVTSPIPDPPRPSASAPVPAAGQLAQERALLDVARTALGRGDGEAALAAAARHERRYPSGALREEREAIAIQALVLTRRFDEARARGARFHERFLGSVLMPAVDASLATIL